MSFPEFPKAPGEDFATDHLGDVESPRDTFSTTHIVSIIRKYDMFQQHAPSTTSAMGLTACVVSTTGSVTDNLDAWFDEM